MNTEPNTIVLLDQSRLSELDDDFLYALNIYLDKPGRSELVYDFPGEEWKDVWERAANVIVEFCKARKMILFPRCEDWPALGRIIEVKSGTLILVDAGELIECLSYPDLDMEIIQRLDGLDNGIYETRLDEYNNLKLKKV